MEALYIIGPVGSGKSTLMAAITATVPVVGTSMLPVAHTQYRHGIQLGWQRDIVPGADTLAMNCITKVEPWIAEKRPYVLLAEGERLATSRFFDFLIATGYHLSIIYLDLPIEFTEQRIAGRTRMTAQTIIESRQTKARGLAKKYRRNTTRLDASRSPDLLATLCGSARAVRSLKSGESRGWG